METKVKAEWEMIICDSIKTFTTSRAIRAIEKSRVARDVQKVLEVMLEAKAKREKTESIFKRGVMQIINGLWKD